MLLETSCQDAPIKLEVFQDEWKQKAPNICQETFVFLVRKKKYSRKKQMHVSLKVPRVKVAILLFLRKEILDILKTVKL